MGRFAINRSNSNFAPDLTSSTPVIFKISSLHYFKKLSISVCLLTNIFIGLKIIFNYLKFHIYT